MCFFFNIIKRFCSFSCEQVLDSTKRELLPLLTSLSADLSKRNTNTHLDQCSSFLQFLLTFGDAGSEDFDRNYMTAQLSCLFKRYPAMLSRALMHMTKEDINFRETVIRLAIDMSNYEDLRRRFNLHLRHAQHISISAWSKTLYPHWRGLV